MLCQICKAENPEDATVCVACGSTPTLAPGATVSGGAVPMGPAKLAGQVIANRYEVRSILGKGGMGVVYRAFDRMLGEDVAIKLLHGTAIGDSGDQERLKREIQTARRITHPNVIRIHDMGVDGEDGFLAMEILTGGSLNRRLARGTPPIGEAVQIAIGICDGLAAAHAKGVIHRDLKPHNVLFDAEGTAKLVDFGLARLAEATSHTMGFSGTPLYMSPEMTDGREITPRSDVYSLGVVLYELFCGRTPFRADTLLRLAMMHAKETPPKPTSIRPDLPPALEQILLKCLQKDPADRFPNAKEVGDALRAFQAGSPLAITLRIPEPTAEAPVAPAPPPPKKRMTAARRFAVIAGPVTALGMAFVVLLHDHVSVQMSSQASSNERSADIRIASAVEPQPPVVDDHSADATVQAASADKPIPPHPTPQRTPARTIHNVAPPPTHLAIAATPPPTPAVVAVAGSAQLTVRADPWAEVDLDHAAIGKSTSIRKLPIHAGRHELHFHGQNYPTPIDYVFNARDEDTLCLKLDAGKVAPCAD